MSTTWKTVYEGTLEGRKLVLRQSGAGGYKLLTEQSVRDVGIAYQDGPTYVHVTPSSVGEPVESEVTTRDSLAEALRELHFSSASVTMVLGATGG